MDNRTTLVSDILGKVYNHQRKAPLLNDFTQCPSCGCEYVFSTRVNPKQWLCQSCYCLFQESAITNGAAA